MKLNWQNFDVIEPDGTFIGELSDIKLVTHLAQTSYYSTTDIDINRLAVVKDYYILAVKNFYGDINKTVHIILYEINFDVKGKVIILDKNWKAQFNMSKETNNDK